MDKNTDLTFLFEGLFERFPKNLNNLLKNYDYFKNHFSSIGLELKDKGDIKNLIKNIKKEKKEKTIPIFKNELNILYSLDRDSIKVLRLKSDYSNSWYYISISDLNKNIVDSVKEISKVHSEVLDIFSKYKNISPYLDHLYYSGVGSIGATNKVEICTPYKKFSNINVFRNYVEKEAIRISNALKLNPNLKVLNPEEVDKYSRNISKEPNISKKDKEFLLANGFGDQFWYADDDNNYLFKKNNEFYYSSHSRPLNNQNLKKVFFLLK